MIDSLSRAEEGSPLSSSTLHDRDRDRDREREMEKKVDDLEGIN